MPPWPLQAPRSVVPSKAVPSLHTALTVGALDADGDALEGAGAGGADLAGAAAADAAAEGAAGAWAKAAAPANNVPKASRREDIFMRKAPNSA